MLKKYPEIYEKKFYLIFLLDKRLLQIRPPNELLVAISTAIHVRMYVDLCVCQSVLFFWMWKIFDTKSKKIPENGELFTS